MLRRPQPTSGLLGDVVERALNRIGVTKDRVEAVVGKCGCASRQRMLNDLHSWAASVVGWEDQQAPAPEEKSPEDKAAEERAAQKKIAAAQTTLFNILGE
jgi:hypothetical protein